MIESTSTATQGPSQLNRHDDHVPPAPPPSRALAAPPAGHAKEPPKPCKCTRCQPDGRTCGSGAEFASGLCRYCKDHCRKKVHFEDDEPEPES
ncbi:phosphatidylserine decarboxylase 1 [Hypoxylon texense]